MRYNVLFIFFLFASFLNAQSTCSFQSVDGYLNSANSLYWLSRTSQNSIPEATKALDYIYLAEKELSNLKIESECLNSYAKSVEVLKKELQGLIEVSSDNFNGVYPILPFIFNQYGHFEYDDEAVETAMETALSNLLESGIYKPSKDLKDVLLYCAIETDQEDLHEVAAQFLHNNSKMYVVSKYELNQVLGRTTLDQDSSLQKLGAYFSSKYFGKLIIDVVEDSDNLSYVGARFKFYDLEKNELLSETYAEGMKIDLVTKKWDFRKLFFLFFIASLVISFIIYYIIQYKSKNEVKILSFFLSSVSSFILSIGASLGVFMLFSLLAPGASDFIEVPTVFLFPYFLVAVLISLPVLLFILAGLVFKRFLSDNQALIFTFLFMSLVGIGFPIGNGAFLYLNSNIPFGYFLAFLMASVCVAYFSSLFLSEQNKQNQGVLKMLLSICFFIPLVVFLVEILKIGGEVSELLVYGSTAASVLPGLLFLKLKNKAKGENLISDKKTSLALEEKLKDLVNTLLTNHANKKNVSFNDGFETQLNTYIQDFKGFRHLHLSGSAGIGKTSLIQHTLLTNKENILGFYGDCDEIQEGSTVPYEPFYQAFSEHLGEGMFYNGSNSAVELLSKAKPLLNLAGVGDIADQVAGENQAFNGASIKEILNNISAYLKSVSATTKKHRIVLVIEDLQWIDSYTQELLMEVIQEFYMLSKKPKLSLDICLITTSSEQTDSMEEILKVSKTLSEKESSDIFMEWDSKHAILNLDELCSKSFVSELLSLKNSGIEVSKNAIVQISNFVQRSEVRKPRYILELLKYLVEKEWLANSDGVLEIKKDIDWDMIPFESELEELYQEQFKSLPEDVLRVLESAAFVGMEFEADLLSKLWKIERLYLIHNLLKAEKFGLVVDLNDQDDYYRFGSKAIRAALKRFSMNEGANTGKIPQIVKEYHREIIAIVLAKYEDRSDLLEKIPDDVLFGLAERAMLVFKEQAQKGQQICVAAAVRSMHTGNLPALNNYLKFLYLMSEEVLTAKEAYWEVFLKANMLELASNPRDFVKSFGESLPKVLGKRLLTQKRSDLELKCYYELVLKIFQHDEKIVEVFEIYKKNPATTLYQVLLEKAQKKAQKFDNDQMNRLSGLHSELDSQEGYTDIKQQVLGILSMLNEGEQKHVLLSQRLKLIFPQVEEGLTISEQLNFIDAHWRSLEFEQIENCGHLLFGMNDYCKKAHEFEYIFTLNKIRLAINERLNHRFGIFTASMELLSCEHGYAYNAFMEVAEQLFYRYSEGSFRGQLYPIWVSKILETGESLEDISSITQTLKGQLSKPNFLTENDKINDNHKRFLPLKKYQELLMHERIKESKEAEVITLLIDLVS